MKPEWPYTGDIRNKKYLADRTKLFNEEGNGWWWGTKSRVEPERKKKPEMSMKIIIPETPKHDAFLKLNGLKKQSYDGKVEGKSQEYWNFTHFPKRAGMEKAITCWQKDTPFSDTFKNRAERRIRKLIKIIKNEEKE